MKIFDLTVNYLETPIGYDFSSSSFSYKVNDDKGSKAVAHQLDIASDSDFTDILYTNNNKETKIPLFYVEQKFASRTRYYWRISVWNDLGVSSSSTSWFETGKLNEKWQSQWISPKNKNYSAPKLFASFQTKKEIKTARLYIVGLGLYEAYLNNEKISEELFTPGYNNYHEWIQYQSYDVTNYLKKDNLIEVILGKGWYLGNFGFHGGSENIYGNQFLLTAELRIVYKDGSEEVFTTDSSWKSTESTIQENSIYYGEDIDDTIDNRFLSDVEVVNGPTSKLRERMSPPVKIMEELPVQSVSYNPEMVLDMGQNMVGWIKFFNTLPKGAKIKFEFAETLVNGQFYRENLREARAAFDYVSNGEEKWVHPHFSFFGFRYVKVSGWPENIEFDTKRVIGQVIYSEMKRTGTFETSNEKLNRLYENIIWSQKGNFLEVPMDCPQRDERMGWTGDAQIFSKTAMYNYHTAAFFAKYGRDMYSEQINHQGAPTMTIPDVPSDMNKGSVAAGVWGDAATIIPWNVYQVTGDIRILKSQFNSMKAWIDYVYSREFYKGLWVNDFQFGDWLALDGESLLSPFGGTEEQFVANVFILYSLRIMKEVSRIIGEDSSVYKERSEELQKAIQNEYLTKNGRLAMDTQTGYVLTLYFDLIPENARLAMIEKLRIRLAKDNYHLKTGFVGTPFLNLVLSDSGLNDIAYTLLLNEDYPSWLYAINLGATTIWERWNSVLPDGTMNPQGMNSLNHYAYGAIGQWLYEYVLGIRSASAGFHEIIIAPEIHWSLSEAKGSFETANGKVFVHWQLDDQNNITMNMEIPFNTEAIVQLPYISEQNLQQIAEYDREKKQLKLVNGKYSFHYPSTENLVRPFDREVLLVHLLEDPLTSSYLHQHFKSHKLLSDSSKRRYKQHSLKELVAIHVIEEKDMLHFIDKLNRMRG